jgi:HEPN domain-containing protein
MNRHDFQVLATQRVREAKVLLDNQCFPGAYYLLGYAVECALKACIARQTNRFDFPDRKTVNDSYTHDLEKLLSVSGLKVEHDNEVKSNPQFADNWAITKDWSEEARYSVDISRAEAENLYYAVTARGNGVLAWLKKWW